MDTHITIPMARLIELETAEHERDILRTNTQILAMMLRKCAHRLKCNGHECGRQWTVPCNFDEDYS